MLIVFKMWYSRNWYSAAIFAPKIVIQQNITIKAIMIVIKLIINKGFFKLELSTILFFGIINNK